MNSSQLRANKKDDIFSFVHLSPVMRKPDFAYAKTKTQISFAVTAKLISAFVFATQLVQSLYFLNPKFQASSHRPWLYSPVCVGPGRKPRRPVFSQRGSFKCNANVMFELPKEMLMMSFVYSLRPKMIFIYICIIIHSNKTAVS